MSEFPEKLLEFLKESAREAGKILLDNYANPQGIQTKKDGTLVSNVDKKVASFLNSKLRNAYPNYAILNEEKKDDFSRLEKEYCFIIDPLDGTREYLAKEGMFSVLIGVTQNGKPLLGVAYRPLANELVYALEGQGAYCENSDRKKKLEVNSSENLILLISSSRSNEEIDHIIQHVVPTQVIRMGSSYKTIEVAKGTADAFICPKSSVMHLWDLCAPEAILREAGGILTDLDGNRIDYRQREAVNKKGVIAATNSAHQKILNKIRGNI